MSKNKLPKVKVAGDYFKEAFTVDRNHEFELNMVIWDFKITALYLKISDWFLGKRLKRLERALDNELTITDKIVYKLQGYK
jgi:hypothetical protein